jgi:hypothetical protein
MVAKVELKQSTYRLVPEIILVCRILLKIAGNLGANLASKPIK